MLLRLGRLQLGHGPRIELCTRQHGPGNLRKMEENQLLFLTQLLSRGWKSQAVRNLQQMLFM